MLCPQHMLCEMVSFSTSNSHQMLPRENAHSHLFPAVTSLFVDVGRVFAALSAPKTHTRTQKPSRRRKDEKAKSLADHWSMTQLWKTQLSNQIVQLEGPEVPQWCPRPLTKQLRGVNMHFSQLSKMCDGGGEAKQKRIEVIPLTNIDSLKYLMGLWKKLKWLKLPNAQIPTQVI